MDRPKTPKQKRNVVPREGRYPMASKAYEYEYQKARQDIADKAMRVFPTLTPEMQDYYGSPQGYMNMIEAGMDYPVQATDKEGTSKFKTPGFANFLTSMIPMAAGQVLHNGIPSTGNLSKLATALGGQPFSSTPTFGGIPPENELAMYLSEYVPYVGAFGTYKLMDAMNPKRYKLKGSNQREDLMNLMKERGEMELMNNDGARDSGFIPQADMSEYGFYPNAQMGAEVSDEMEGGEQDQEQQQAQLQQTIVKLIQQFKTPEAIQKYLIQQGIDRQSLSQVMMMVQQMMQGQEPEYQNGGMPSEIALARFKASGREKGFVGSELEAHVEKMKSRYGYQKGGAVKSQSVNSYDIREMFESGGRIQYQGHSFPGYNKPIKTPKGDKHKKMALVKKGDKVRLVKYGLRGR